jgi:hypothetical protein
MKHLRLISNPTYPLQAAQGQSTQGQSIQPVDFIWHWSLCYDLGQVIVYLAHSVQDHRDDAESCLYDLKMAQWHLFNRYLAESISLSVSDNHDSRILHAPLFQKMRTSPFPMMSEAVATEWGLSGHLKEVVFYITLYRNFYPLFPYMRPIFLKQALKHLKREIQSKESSVPGMVDELVDEPEEGERS